MNIPSRGGIDRSVKGDDFRFKSMWKDFSEIRGHKEVGRSIQDICTVGIEFLCKGFIDSVVNLIESLLNFDGNKTRNPVINPKTFNTFIEKYFNNQLKQACHEVAVLPTSISKHCSEKTEIHKEEVHKNKNYPSHYFEFFGHDPTILKPKGVSHRRER